MKKLLFTTALVAALAVPAAHADGFVAVGGAAAGVHYATEATMSGHGTAAGACVHNGILGPVDPESAAGIGTVATPAALTLAYDAALQTVTIYGASSAARVILVAMDGRNLPCILTENALSLSNLAKGIYIVRVVDGSASATLKVAL